MDEFKANITYNIDAAIKTHIENLRDLCSTESKSTIDLTHIQAVVYDFCSPFTTYSIFRDFVTNKLESKSEFYKQMEERIPFLVYHGNPFSLFVSQTYLL